MASKRQRIAEIKERIVQVARGWHAAIEKGVAIDPEINDDATLRPAWEVAMEEADEQAHALLTLVSELERVEGS